MANNEIVCQKCGNNKWYVTINVDFTEFMFVPIPVGFSIELECTECGEKISEGISIDDIMDEEGGDE